MVPDRLFYGRQGRAASESTVAILWPEQPLIPVITTNWLCPEPTLRVSQRKRNVCISITCRTTAPAGIFGFADSQSSNPGSIPGSATNLTLSAYRSLAPCRNQVKVRPLICSFIWAAPFWFGDTADPGRWRVWGECEFGGVQICSEYPSDVPFPPVTRAGEPFLAWEIIPWEIIPRH